jgi:hypothetical protein
MIVEIKLQAKWQFKEYTYYKITACKKIVNTKTGNLVKCVKVGGSIGYYINKVFYKKSDINKYIELIPKNSNCPF